MLFLPGHVVGCEYMYKLGIGLYITKLLSIPSITFR